MAPNNTDIIVQDQLLSNTRKIELDDKPTKGHRFRAGMEDWVMLPSHPLGLALETLAWVQGSALSLLIASVWSPFAILWGLWCLYLVILVWLPTGFIGTPTRLCAGIRLLQILIGACSLLL